MKSLLAFIFIIKYIVTVGYVCSEDELIQELREDIMDNGSILYVLVHI